MANKRAFPTISVNGEKVARFDPIEFFGITLTDPRVTLREDNAPTQNRTPGRTGRIKKFVNPDHPLMVCDEHTTTERNRRIYNRDW